jgi:hypothetical protein
MDFDGSTVILKELIYLLEGVVGLGVWKIMFNSVGS